MTGRDYPVLRPPGEGDEDPRFTYGLVFEVADVLANHGFPPVRSGEDLVELRQALFGFLYGPQGSEVDR